MVLISKIKTCAVNNKILHSVLRGAEKGGRSIDKESLTMKIVWVVVSFALLLPRYGECRIKNLLGKTGCHR